ncbi:hypothetical protein ACFPPD_15465 [Cohnella suwonensis]|uniref:Uncharacterized protein n=1 Tax=Cohnella suwonensis TaxID=696072 RepID=A0ABW0LZE0_9BACL
MNRESVNNQVSRLPMAMAGIVHARREDGRSLSVYRNAYTISRLEKRLLP